MNWWCAMMCIHCHFQKYIHGSKRLLNTHGRRGGSRKLIGTGSMYSHRPPPGNYDTLAQWKIEIESNTFWKGWIRTAGKRQLVMAARTSYGFRFGRSRTSWKAYQVYFHMDPASYPYLLGVGRSHRFTTETLSVHGAASPDFDPMGCVSSGAQ